MNTEGTKPRTLRSVTLALLALAVTLPALALSAPAAASASMTKGADRRCNEVCRGIMRATAIATQRVLAGSEGASETPGTFWQKMNELFLPSMAANVAIETIEIANRVPEPTEEMAVAVDDQPDRYVLHVTGAGVPGATLPRRGQDTSFDRLGLHRGHAPFCGTRRGHRCLSKGTRLQRCDEPSRYRQGAGERVSVPARKAVAIGGGTGLPSVLRCLLDSGFETSAIVTMADDGGSSGMLRRDLGILPPGDIRNCLVAMAAEGNPFRELFQYRFDAGEGLEGHALGNLIIAALTDTCGSFMTAIEAAEKMLDSRGRVLPSTLQNVQLTAVGANGNLLRGQSRIAHTVGPIARVHMEPDRPVAYPPAIEATKMADVIVVGPGSLFTSLLPNFMVDGLIESVRRSSAVKVYVCNLANAHGETSGMDAADHVEALVAHGLADIFDVVLVHVASSDETRDVIALCDDDGDAEPVCADATVRSRIEDLGPRVVAGDLVSPECPTRHDPEQLPRLLSEVFR